MWHCGTSWYRRGSEEALSDAGECQVADLRRHMILGLMTRPLDLGQPPRHFFHHLFPPLVGVLRRITWPLAVPSRCCLSIQLSRNGEDMLYRERLLCVRYGTARLR